MMMNSSWNNNYRVVDKHFHKNSSNYHSIQPTPRLDSVNGLCSLSDNFPGSSMSVADIFLTMSNDGGQNNIVYPGQTFLAGQIENLSLRTHASLFPTSPQSPQLNQTASHQIPHCAIATCDNKICAWHWCVLNNPQFVRWQAMPVKVHLKRSSKESFGFLTKAKDYSSKDKNEIETYTIVTQVEPNSVAEQAGLAVGDFVRSANHVALDTKQQYRQFKATLKDLESINMQIQRPEDVSPKGATMLDEFLAGQTPSTKRPKPVTPSTSPDDNFLPVSHQSEAIPLQTFKSKTQAQLPHARLIVCGNRTNEFIQSFMGSFVQFPANVHASYHHVSMETCADGSVGVSNSKSFSCMFGEACQDSINVDIISVVNDNFFHHCCPWIFTPDCVFVLTFDVNRLAQFSDLEMARLTSLKHTVQTSSSGSTSRIKVVGITLPGEGLSFEEIRTLFYTSLGESLPEPNFVPISSTRTHEMQEFQVQIFEVLKEIAMQKSVVLPALNVVDCLISHQNLTINNEELASTLTVWNLGSDTQFIGILVEDLKKTGNLISLTNSEYIIPSKLFDYLVHVTMSTDRIHPSSSGIITRAHILEYLDNFTSDPVKSLACFEDLRIMFPVNIRGLDSGFSEDAGILFPFALEELSFEFQTDSYQEVFSICFAESIRSAVYYSWLSKLSQACGCQLLEMVGQWAARFLIDGLDLICSWNKICNGIDVCNKGISLQSSRNYYTGQLHRVEKILSSITRMLLYDFCIDWKGDMGSDTSHNVSEVYLPSPHSGRCLYLPGVNILRKEDRITPQLTAVNEGQEEEYEWLLDCAINTIPHITDPLQEMYKHLSVNQEWERLASNLGQTTKQVSVYSSLFVANPSRLPAETFYIHFTSETMCTLGDIVSGLFFMADDNHYCQKIAESLLTTAWNKYRQNKDRSCSNPKP